MLLRLFTQRAAVAPVHTEGTGGCTGHCGRRTVTSNSEDGERKRVPSMLAWRLKDVNTGEKVGSLPERLPDSARSLEVDDAVAAAAGKLMELRRPMLTSERRGDARDVDLYREPAKRVQVATGAACLACSEQRLPA
jgi:hypothetical protein